MDETKIDLEQFIPVAPDATDAEPAGDIAERLTESGATRADVGGITAFKTNHGTVILGSPADQARLAMTTRWRRSSGRAISTEELEWMIEQGERST